MVGADVDDVYCLTHTRLREWCLDEWGIGWLLWLTSLEFWVFWAGFLQQFLSCCITSFKGSVDMIVSWLDECICAGYCMCYTSCAANLFSCRLLKCIVNATWVTVCPTWHGFVFVLTSWVYTCVELHCKTLTYPKRTRNKNDKHVFLFSLFCI